jgi:hypothetical protein
MKAAPEGGAMDSSQYRERLLVVARQRLRQIPGAYERFRFAAETEIWGAVPQWVLPAAVYVAEQMGDPRASALLIERLQTVVDRWAKANLKPLAIEPLVLSESMKEAAREKPEQRQARRYGACISAGLKMPTDDYSHLPRGIGKLAEAEGITRQAFSDDVKAHIRRLNGRQTAGAYLPK